MQQLTDADWKEADAITQKLYGFSHPHVKAFYMKKGLSFWEGAATWIEDIPVIQLHPKLKCKKLLGLYDKKEILAHESVHALRAPLNSVRFEEHFAYRTSTSRWRRYFGPLFRSHRESSFFLLLLAFCTLGSFFFFPLFLAPWLVLGTALIRLMRTHRVLERCAKKLPYSSLVRCTDEEIQKLFKST